MAVLNGTATKCLHHSILIVAAGLLYDPPSRNWKAYINEHYDQAHALTAGGKMAFCSLNDTCGSSVSNARNGSAENGLVT